jgi:hypothetical protein
LVPGFVEHLQTGLAAAARDAMTELMNETVHDVSDRLPSKTRTY